MTDAEREAEIRQQAPNAFPGLAFDVEFLLRLLDEARAGRDALQAEVVELGVHIRKLGNDLDNARAESGARGNKVKYLLTEITRLTTERVKLVAEHQRTLAACEGVIEGLEEDVARLSPPPGASRWRHKQRGTTYQVIGFAEVKAPKDEPLEEPEVVIVYRSEQDGELWVRRRSEFEDGQFELLPPSEPAPPGASAMERAATVLGAAKTRYENNPPHIGDTLAYHQQREAARAIEAAERRGRAQMREEALHRIDAIHEGKDNSRDPGVVDNTCQRIGHMIRALPDGPSQEKLEC